MMAKYVGEDKGMVSINFWTVKFITTRSDNVVLRLSVLLGFPKWGDSK